ncbi:signal peptidase II [Clostridium tetani]|nr:signal peptidase II [Clostridium tetani]QBD87053.1 signal peptidase II [Clostridium tetani]
MNRGDDVSKFFNVTHDKDIVLDDSIISNKTGWTSKKIHKEIVDKRITKFEELEDVDVVNKQDKQLVAYSKDTGKFTTINGTEAGEITGASMKQISKMGVIGSPEEPRIVNISVNTIDFKVPRVNVLKYDLGTQNIILTKNEFTNGESNDFEKDPMMVFDGKAHLKTEHTSNFAFNREMDIKSEYVVTFKKSNFKKVESFKIGEDGVIKTLVTTAIPHDRLLIPKCDMNLSNVENIDYFNLTATGENIRIVCSVDSGQTWKVFKNEKWVDINLDVEDIRTNGMTIDLFNSINDVFWNELVTTKKIRFAYLLSMNNIDNIEELKNLDLQYDGEGKWIQAKEDTFDVVYASNTLLQVHVKFNGDIKINY